MRRLVLLGLVLVLLLSAGVVLAAGEGGATKDGGGGYELPSWVIAGGGGRTETRSYALTGTIGQAVVGVGSGGDYEVCSGFWAGPCGWEPAMKWRIYLPVVMR